MNNYKKYLKYKYKYYALKKQIGGGKVAITSLTVYDPSRKKKEQDYNKVRKDIIPYSWADILKNLTVDKKFKIILPNSSNELSEANISTILNKHTGFIIETNDDFLNNSFVITSLAIEKNSRVGPIPYPSSKRRSTRPDSNQTDNRCPKT